MIILETMCRALQKLGFEHQNAEEVLHSYVIQSLDGDPYITRTLLPRSRDQRIMIHEIHREDRDRHFHNHPWHVASFLIVSGGYVEHRPDGPESVIERILGPGDRNLVRATDFHKIVMVRPNTWTIGLVGRRVQDWGFLVNGKIIPHEEYAAQSQGGLV